jgi:MarR family transcriptional regulator, organic hydroperoxide resistance regulator
VLHLDYGTLSPLLKRLEAAGLITRVRRRDDERSVTIALTPAGDAMRSQAEAVPDRLTCAIGLDDQATRDLLHALRDLTAAVTRASGDHSPPGN